MSVEKYTLNKGREVLVGLRWVPIVEDELTPDIVSEYIIENDNPSGIVEWNSRQKISLGFDTREETNALTASLALMGVQSIQSNWVGIFILGDKYWLGASLNSHPYPLADKIFDGDDQKDEIIQALNELRQLINPTKIFAPAHFEIDGASEFDLSEFDEPTSSMLVRNPEPSLVSQMIDFITVYKKQITIGAIMCALFYVGWNQVAAYQARQDRQEKERAAAVANVKKKNQAILDKQKALAEFKSRWETKPLPSSHVSSCFDSLYTLRRPVAGWKNKDEVCEGATVTISKERSWGNENRLAELTVEWSASYVLISDDTANVSLLWDQPTFRGEQTLTPLNVSEASLKQWVFGKSIELKLGETSEEGLSPGTDNMIYSTTFKMSGIRDLKLLSRFLDELPGVSILIAKKTDKRWIIEGEIYHV